MKTKPCHWTLRALSVLLTGIMAGSSMPGCLWAQDLTPRAQPPAPVRAATSALPPGPIPIVPRFSAQPTEAEIFGVPVFSEPLVAIAKTSPAENRALADAVLAYALHTESPDPSPLTDFLEAFPNSAWKPALLLNLGILWRNAGHFSRATAAWQEAWQLSKNVTAPAPKGMADRILGELVQVHDWAGNYETLEPLLEVTKDRCVTGFTTEALRSARLGLAATKRGTADFKCGPYALQQLSELNETNHDIRTVLRNRVFHQGSSLLELQQLALQAGLKYQMAKRQTGAHVPPQSVVHWRLNHYSAISEESEGVFRVLDTAFTRRYKAPLTISRETLDEESDGYFLIPQGPLADGWEPVSPDEGRSVRGRGDALAGPDTDAYTPNDLKITGGCPKPGMPAYSAHIMLVSLNIEDIPVGYIPALGPSAQFKVTYNQKDKLPRGNRSFSNLGPKWTFDWFSCIEDSGVYQSRDSVTRYCRGGGEVTHHGYNSTTGLYSPDLDGERLQYIPGTATTAERYELVFADGSREVFAQPSTTIQGARMVYLTAICDSHGNTLSIVYEPGPGGSPRVSHVVDAMKQVTTFHYDRADVGFQYDITSIEDPLGHFAHFEYNTSGQLEKITDVVGMVSTFTYGSDDFITQMQTPYGATTFSFKEVVNPPTRTLLVVEPELYDGTHHVRQCIRYENHSSLPDTEPSAPTVPSSSIQPRADLCSYRNSFYFDRYAMQSVSLGDTVDAIEADLDTKLTSSTVYHWLHQTTDHGVFSSGLLESVKPPSGLGSRVWLLYPGQTTPAYEQVLNGVPDIRLRQPSAITRFVETQSDPDNSLGQPASQVYRFQYNTLGMVTNYIDPLQRAIGIDCYPNDIDILKVWLQKSGGNDLLAEFSGYNAQHQPSTYIDAARKSYALEWYPNGWLKKVINPKNEITQLSYDDAAPPLTLWYDIGSGGNQIRTTVVMDPLGRPQSVTDTDGYTLTYGYDQLNRLTRLTYPDGTFERYDYSRLDLVRVWDRAGHPTQITYDESGRPLTIKDRLGQTTQFSWCGCGGLNAITDPIGHQTSWTRDALGRVCSKTYHDGKTLTYAYQSLSGNLRCIKDPNPTDQQKQLRGYTYFLDGTLASVQYTLGTVGGAHIANTPNVTFGYDPKYWRPTSMADGIGNTTYTYKPAGTLGAGHLDTITGPLNNNGTYNIAYTYDELGRLLSQNINGATQNVTYDTYGRLETHTATPLSGTPFHFYYADILPNLSLRLGSMSYPDGQTTSFGYQDALHDFRPNLVWHQKGAWSMDRFDYQFDVLGRITQWKQQRDGNTPQVETLEYDFEDRLINAVTAPQGQAGALGYTYVYDQAGNRLSEQIDTTTPSRVTTVTASSYNEVNHLMQRSGSGATLPVRFKGTVNEAATVKVDDTAALVSPDPDNSSHRVYTLTKNLQPGTKSVTVQATDVQGQQTTKAYTLTIAGGADKTYSYDFSGNTYTAGNTTYTWDAENRLVKITNGSLTSDFSYDGFGRLVKIIENGNSATTKQFIWSGAVLCEERDHNNNVTRRFFPEGEQINGSSYYYCRDHLGSVREMTDSQGGLVARYDYDPFGRRSPNSIGGGGAVDSDFGFTGLYYHQPSGLQLALFRAYDADSGRWLNRDPIGEPGGLNLYGYVGDNPINWRDLLGLDYGFGELAEDLGMDYDAEAANARFAGAAQPVVDQILDAVNNAFLLFPGGGSEVKAAGLAVGTIRPAAREALRGVPGVYKVCLNNGKRYVGQANNIYRRLKDHVYKGHWKWDDIKQIMVEEAKNLKRLNQREREILMEETGGLHPSRSQNVLNERMPPHP